MAGAGDGPRLAVIESAQDSEHFAAVSPGVVYLSPVHWQASLGELNRSVVDGPFVSV